MTKEEGIENLTMEGCNLGARLSFAMVEGLVFDDRDSSALS